MKRKRSKKKAEKERRQDGWNVIKKKKNTLKLQERK